MSSAPLRRVGSCWYRSQNHGRTNIQIAAQRWISELIRDRRITRGQRLLLEVLARYVDARGTTQKSVAYLAEQCGVNERTIQRYLRGLCPSKAANPDGWAARVVTRRFIHAAPEPGRKADNVPSWFTLEIPERFKSPKSPMPNAPTRLTPPPAPKARPLPKVSPGGVENVTQAVILGSDQVEITETIHPCSNLARSGSAAKPAASSPSKPPEQAAPPHGPPAGGGGPGGNGRGGGGAHELVQLAAKLFPSHAPVAARAVARLQALGWTGQQIAEYLRKASKDARVGMALHPLPLAVWLAEQEHRQPPPQPRPPRPRHDTPRGDGPPPAAAPPVPRELAARIERARAAQQAALEKHPPPAPRRSTRPPVSGSAAGQNTSDPTDGDEPTPGDRGPR